MIVSQFGSGFRVAVVFLNHFVGFDEMAFAFIFLSRRIVSIQIGVVFGLKPKLLSEPIQNNQQLKIF